MPPTYLGRGRRHGLGQRCGICEHLSPTHNLSQALIASLPAKLNSTQLRRQVGGQCLGEIICRRKCSHLPQLTQVGRRHMRTRLKCIKEMLVNASGG